MKTKEQFGTVLNNERGLVLVVSVLLLSVLAVLGTTTVLQTSTDLKISSNYKTAVRTFYEAEAGIEEARARLKSSSDSTYAGDPAAYYDPLWSAYITSTGPTSPATVDPDYDTNYKNYFPTTASHTNTTLTLNSLQSDIGYFVKIRHKREFNAEQAGHTTAVPHYYDNDGSTSTNTSTSPGSIVYFGYGDPSRPTTAVQFTTAGTTEHKPVDIVVGYAVNGNTVKTVTAEVVKNPGPPIKSPLYAKDDVVVNGVSANIDGTDHCGMASDKPPVYTLSPHTTSPSVNPSHPDEIYTGNPTDPVTGPDNIDITGYVNRFKSSATEIITADQNGTNYGDGANFVTCYCDATSFTSGLEMRNVNGYGILLVEGDLVMSGGFNWNGLVLVTGTIVFNGGGPHSINVQGAVLGNQTVDLNGGVDVTYDSCMINDSLDGYSPVVISWKDDTN